MEIKKRLCVLCPLPGLGSLGEKTGREVFDAVTASPLRGRGFGGFETAEKWRLLDRSREQRAIIALVSGDCAAALMEANREAVYAGAALSARAFGCGSLWFVTDRDFGALPEEYFGLRFRHFSMGHSISAGEETRIFAAIEGDVPVARIQPPYPTERGLYGRPTLIHSAETLAHIPYILLGCDRATKLAAVSGDLASPGIYETAQGTPVGEILSGAGAGELKAALVGGSAGGFLTGDGLGVPYDYAALAAAGSAVGDGSIKALSSERCMVQETLIALNDCFRASCGKCVFCREGSYQLYLLIKDLSEGKASDGDLSLIRDIASVMEQSAACGHGQGAGRMTRSALDGFSGEFEAHVLKKCAAMRCPAMFSVHILGDKCSGCGDCRGRCAAGAVAGGEGLIHVIEQAKCTRCMACLPCPAGAIVKAGLVKPVTPEKPVPVGSFALKKKGLQRRS